MTTTLTQVFYTKSKALQIQLSENGIFFEIAPALSETDKTYDWKSKKSVKFSVSELCNIMTALENFRLFGSEHYTKVSQSICGQAYKNMQFVHKNRKGQDVRTGLNLYKDNISFIIVNNKADINLAFPILNSEKVRLEIFLRNIINSIMSEPSKYQRVEQEDEIKNEIKDIKATEPLKDNILEFKNSQKEKVLERFKQNLRSCKKESDVINLRHKFLEYCKQNKFDFSFVEIEGLFLMHSDILEKSKI